MHFMFRGLHVSGIVVPMLHHHFPDDLNTLIPASSADQVETTSYTNGLLLFKRKRILCDLFIYLLTVSYI